MRGLPDTYCSYTRGVKASGDHDVCSRMSCQSDSISSRSDSRQAFSCGESTSTPSTSKIAPRNIGMVASLLDDWRARAQFEFGVVARTHLADLVANAQLERSVGALGVHRQREAFMGERDENAAATELHGEGKGVQLAREPRLEMQVPIPHLGAREIALDQVERPGHDTGVDAFLRGATLNVFDITLQRHHKPLPGTVRIKCGQNSSVGHEAQCRTVRSPSVVVLDVPLRRIVAVLITEALEDTREFGAREEEEEHHRIGLLADLVAVRVVALSAQDAV